MTADAGLPHPGRRRATVDDVARRAGVSRQTVSRVVNDSGPVALATRSRVQAAVDALDYVPDPAAQRMGRTRAARTSGPVDDVVLPAGALDAIDRLRAMGLSVEVLVDHAVVVTVGTASSPRPELLTVSSLP